MQALPTLLDGPALFGRLTVAVDLGDLGVRYFLLPALRVGTVRERVKAVTDLALEAFAGERLTRDAGTPRRQQGAGEQAAYQWDHRPDRQSGGGGI